jgi:hypothetical protein
MAMASPKLTPQTNRCAEKPHIVSAAHRLLGRLMADESEQNYRELYHDLAERTHLTIDGSELGKTPTGGSHRIAVCLWAIIIASIFVL